MQTRLTLGCAAAASLGAMLVIGAITTPSNGPTLVATSGAVALVTGLMVCFVIRRIVQHELQALHQLAAAIDDVDLDGSPLYRNLADRGPPEVERIVAAWNGFALRFDIMIHGMRDSTSTLNEATKQMAAIGPCAARRAEQQVDAVRQLVADIEILSEPSASGEAATANVPARADAEQLLMTATDLMTDVAATMEQMQDDSQSTLQVLQTIDKCAFRTSVLTVNAAIEAARVGDHGSGFTTVADQVRVMAQRSTEIARDGETALERSLQASERVRHKVAALHEQLRQLLARYDDDDAVQDSQRSHDDAADGAKVVGQKLLTEVGTVAQRTNELAAAASDAASAAAAIEASIWPPSAVDNRDIVALGDARRPAPAFVR